MNIFPATMNHQPLGTSMELKPFYIRSATVNDIEMCCYKKHLHARWSINMLIDCAKEQNLDLGNINTYKC